MRKLLTIILALFATVALAACSRDSSKKGVKSLRNLDLILAGPFIITTQQNCWGTSSCMEVWIPDVQRQVPPYGPSHSQPILFGFQGQFYELEKNRNYELTGMIPAANFSFSTSFVNPVQNAYPLVLPGKKLHLPQAPSKFPYLILRLPLPKEIVPWNADELEPKITSPAQSAHAPGEKRYSTMTILRYDYDDSTSLNLKSTDQNGAADLNGALQVPGLGTERVLMIEVIPQKPGPKEDEHQHSREAYAEIMSLMGLKGSIDFETPSERNKPLDPNVKLPDDLLNFINSNLTLSRGRINDCKAMAVFVDPTS